LTLEKEYHINPLTGRTAQLKNNEQVSAGKIGRLLNRKDCYSKIVKKQEEDM
jgi:hypothetical protein